MQDIYAVLETVFITPHVDCEQYVTTYYMTGIDRSILQFYIDILQAQSPRIFWCPRWAIFALFGIYYNLGFYLFCKQKKTQQEKLWIILEFPLLQFEVQESI